MGTELEGVLDYDNLGPSSDGVIIAPLATRSGTRCLPPILEGYVQCVRCTREMDVHTVRRHGCWQKLASLHTVNTSVG